MSESTLEQAIRARRSIRSIEGPPLSPDEVTTLVELALTAPAPHHTQPWRFVDVSTERRLPLARAMGFAWQHDLERDGVDPRQQRRALNRSRRQLVEAPTLLLGCLVGDGLNHYADERRQRAEWGLAMHSFGAALQNLLLAASVRGLGAYWISAPLYAPEAVRAVLTLEEGWHPQAFVAAGRPAAGYRPFVRPEPDLSEHLVAR